MEDEGDSFVNSFKSRYRSLRPNFHPVDFHSFVGVTRKSTVTPPASFCGKVNLLDTEGDTHALPLCGAKPEYSPNKP